MELVTPRKYGELAAEKIEKERLAFVGDKYGKAVKDFVASTLKNFCRQDERFARVVYETEATLSDCCAKIMRGCGTHISDIDVYRGAVRYYFPNAEVVFSLTIDASGDLPTADEMAKPEKNAPKTAGNSDQPEEDDAGDGEEPTKPTKRTARKPKKAPKAAKPAPTPKAEKPAEQPKQAPEIKQVEKPKKESKRKSKADAQDDGLIQLTLF